MNFTADRAAGKRSQTRARAASGLNGALSSLESGKWARRNDDNLSMTNDAMPFAGCVFECSARRAAVLAGILSARIKRLLTAIVTCCFKRDCLHGENGIDADGYHKSFERAHPRSRSFNVKLLSRGCGRTQKKSQLNRF